jgi:hypothetical protein
MNTNVEHHAAALEKAAAAMTAAGIGSDPKAGHAATLIAMAADLRAQAAVGRQPTTFDGMSAVADQGDESGELAARRKGRALTLIEAVTAAKGDQTRLQALSNLRARALRVGVSLDSDTVLTLPALDAALDRAGAKIDERFALKCDMHRAGILAA